MNKTKEDRQQLKNKIKEQYSELTEDDLLEIEGNPDILIGKLQERYDMTFVEANKRTSSILSDTKIQGEDNQGEGNIEAGRRFQDAQHEFAEKNTDNKNNLDYSADDTEALDGGKSTLTDADQYAMDTKNAANGHSVSKEDMKKNSKQHKRRTEDYISK